MVSAHANIYTGSSIYVNILVNMEVRSKNFKVRNKKLEVRDTE